MKKIGSFLLALVLFAAAALPAGAASRGVSTEIERLADGSYYVIEVLETSALARTGKSGSKTATYYNSQGNAVFAVTVQGTFEYSYGVSSSAKTASATVAIYQSNASYRSKDSYVSGSSAVAIGYVSYLGSTTSKTVTLTCDIYGTLS